ncbi:hypothetical protein LP420_08215 [Massilia sp. B-10]|nr:hypothetical protein LP420_08215 [Massilia sp. B-10]
MAKALVGTLDWGLNVQQAINLPNFGSRNGPTELETGRFQPGRAGRAGRAWPPAAQLRDEFRPARRAADHDPRRAVVVRRRRSAPRGRGQGRLSGQCWKM